MKRQREYASSPPYKRVHYGDEFYQLKSTIIDLINDNIELDESLRERYITDFLRQSSRAQSPQQLQKIASPFLFSPTSPDSHAAMMSSSSNSSPYSTPLTSRPTSYMPDVFSEEESGRSILSDDDSDEIFGDSPTVEYFPMQQKAHGTGITRDTRTSSYVQRMFSGLDLCFIDMHQTGQDYGPGVYDREIFPSFVSAVQEGYSSSKRQGNVVVMKRFTMHLQIVLPGRTITELSSGLLNDELRILIVKDTQPHPNPPKVTDVLSVHDSHHTINAFINPATSDRFTILYDTSFFMQYTTLWEFTRGGAEKEAKVLPCDIKEVIDIDLCDDLCTFDRNQTNYQSLIDYNLFAMFITARGVKLTHGYLSDVEEAETFIVDWSARLVFK